MNDGDIQSSTLRTVLSDIDPEHKKMWLELSFHFAYAVNPGSIGLPVSRGGMRNHPRWIIVREPDRDSSQKPLESIKNKVEPEIEVGIFIVAGLHRILYDHLPEVRVLGGGYRTEEGRRQFLGLDVASG